MAEYNFGLDSADHNQFGNLTGNFLVRIRKPNAGSTMSYSTLALWQASGMLTDGNNPGAGDLTSDPLFVNASGTMSSVADFALQANSPCKRAGRSGVDMGANASLVGPEGTAPSTKTPAKPQSLKIR
jgi:hypothetical protein